VVAKITIDLEAVIIAVTQDVPRVLTVNPPSNEKNPALPSGLLDPISDATLEKALRAWVTRQTGLGIGYVEQLYTFGDRARDPRERDISRERHISVAYLALTRETRPAATLPAAWRNIYHFLPWENWHVGRPGLIDEHVLPGLNSWLEQRVTLARKHEQSQRIQTCFAPNGGTWDVEACLDRYELLFEAGLIAESPDADEPIPGCGLAMQQDHRRILATALGRLRGKIRYRPVVFELLDAEFTLSQLQGVVEALAGSRLHKQNFRRLVARAGLVESTGKADHSNPGRPAGLFRFRREVFRERPAPGLRFSGAQHVGG